MVETRSRAARREAGTPPANATAVLPAPSPQPRRQARPLPAASPRATPSRKVVLRSSPVPAPWLQLFLRVLAGVGLLLVVSMAAIVRAAGGAYVQSVMGMFEAGLPLPVTADAAVLHSTLFVADLHCDASFVPRCARCPCPSPTSNTLHLSFWEPLLGGRQQSQSLGTLCPAHAMRLHQTAAMHKLRAVFWF